MAGTIPLLITQQVDESDQGTIQCALTSLSSVTNIIAPLFFTTGLFKLFTSDAAPFELPGAPFLVGAMLLAISSVVARAVFAKFPRT